MIELHQVVMTVLSRGQQSTVLSGANLVIPSDRRIALLGPSNEDKHILINLLAGIMMPRAGRIVRRAKVSFPVGFSGGFSADLPARANVAHLARLYGSDEKTLVEFVKGLADLGPLFDEPFGLLPPQARKMLAQIVAFAIPFDLYLLSDHIARGNPRQGNVAYDLFEARARQAGVIVSLRNPKLAIRDNYEMAVVLDRGQLALYDDVEDAVLAVED
jgi:capsular polysaccharide transport system ATP-binding protein